MSETNTFIFRDKTFLPATLPGAVSVEGDFEKNLSNANYLQSQQVGDNNGLSYTLYEREGAEWIIVFSTCSYYCAIYCNSWVDLIELLSKLSTIALAGALNNTSNGTAYFVAETKTPDG